MRICTHPMIKLPTIVDGNKRIPPEALQLGHTITQRATQPLQGIAVHCRPPHLPLAAHGEFKHIVTGMPA
jgi:hypothetical protein